MLTAEEAREQMNQNIGIMNEAQLNDLAFQIENAISLGKCYTLTYDLTKSNRAHLESLGYTIKAVNQYNEFSYIISW